MRAVIVSTAEPSLLQPKAIFERIATLFYNHANNMRLLLKTSGSHSNVPVNLSLPSSLFCFLPTWGGLVHTQAFSLVPSLLTPMTSPLLAAAPGDVPLGSCCSYSLSLPAYSPCPRFSLAPLLHNTPKAANIPKPMANIDFHLNFC